MTGGNRPPIGGLALLPDDVEAQSARDYRRSGRSGAHDGEYRTQGQKDVDRLLYARSFLRLGAVTQVATPDPLRPVIHNRLTHTLKVAQIARTIAGNLICAATVQDGPAPIDRDLVLSLGGLDASVAEAAALAHDLGHPPFGHAGETVLDRLALRTSSPIPVADGFEGNAQSFRFAVKSDPMYDFQFGLDLTAATNAAILKYPWPRPTAELPAPDGTPEKQLRLRNSKFGYFRTETAEFEDVRNWLPADFNDPAKPRQTLEASIMDIADDITYAVHDYEDFLSMGLLHRDSVRADLQAVVNLKDLSERTGRTAVTALVNEMKSYDRFDLDLLRDVASVHLSSFDSLLLSPYDRAFRNSLLDELLGFESIEVTETPQNDVSAHVAITARPWHLVEMLKFLVKHYVINSTDLALLQAGQGALLRKGVDRFVKWRDEDADRLPRELSDRLKQAAQAREEPARAYLDYVCTLGDDQFEAITLGLSGERTPKLAGGSPVG